MADSSAVTKAVVLAAGLGTRFLPATKATPKEMLPIVDKPAIQYVVEEAVSAGLDDVLFVTGRNKRSIEDHFDPASELKEARGPPAPWGGGGDPGGRPPAALRPAGRVAPQPFAVLLGDDLIDPRDPLLT